MRNGMLSKARRPEVQDRPLAAVSRKRQATPSARVTEEQILTMSDAEYMNPAQLDFFGKRLKQMRDDLLERSQLARESLGEGDRSSDPADRASQEEERFVVERLAERNSTLLRKVDDALERMRHGSYGYCVKSGDPIGIPRLLARPTASLRADIKDLDERRELSYRQ